MCAARLLLLGLVVAACAEPTTTGDPATARFAGEWMVDQPSHALYEASWYRFHDDGRVEHVRDCSFGGPVPTGFVTDATGAVRCEFADRWSAADPTTLVIDGACSDGEPRAIALGFPVDTTGNAGGQPAIEVVAVGGAAGWDHAPFDWVWHKCGSAGCTPALACP